MTVKTNLAELEEVQTAISKILLKGQTWSATGQALTRADLDSLYQRQRELIPLVARDTEGGGIRLRGATPTG